MIRKAPSAASSAMSRRAWTAGCISASSIMRSSFYVLVVFSSTPMVPISFPNG
jgi:hypothetical protein